MNILFLFQRFSFSSKDLYLDLVTACAEAGHKVFVLAGTSENKATDSLVDEGGCSVAYVKLPDQFKAGKIKKGLVQLFIEPIFKRTIKKLLWQERIDIVAYPTPPITLAGVVSMIKKHYGARSYLMLKDIFPQNAVDLGMMAEGSFLHKYFKGVERKLYLESDVIGCMSPANIEYIKNHNPYAADRLELFPNTIAITEDTVQAKKPGSEAVISFMLGGNLGKPQGLEFLLKGIKKLDDEGFNDAQFMIVGKGTESAFVKKYIADNALKNVRYLESLPKDEYEELLLGQDVGLISLSEKFTFPNFPSRLLSYMHRAKPVFVVTDEVCDMGKIVTEDAHCGYYAKAGDIEAFAAGVKQICKERSQLFELGKNGRRYLEENYDVRMSVKLLERAAVK